MKPNAKVACAAGLIAAWMLAAWTAGLWIGAVFPGPWGIVAGTVSGGLMAWSGVIPGLNFILNIADKK